MDRLSTAHPRRVAVPLIALLALAGCTAAATPAPTTPEPTAMMEHSAMPSESAMMEHSAMPSESAMMEHSAMPSTAAPVSSGTFHKVDGTAQGTVALFHNPDGTFTITFEDFSIDSAAGTHVVLVTNKDVTKDGDVDKTALVDLGPLKGTTGMQDFAVPASADAMTFHTVVLWDTGMAHAIAAAPLQ
jgi:Electron transfer DM13